MPRLPARALAAFGLALVLLPLAPPAGADPLPPLPPRDFQGTYNATAGTVTLTWQPPDLDHDYTYILYRGTTPLAEVAGLSYVDTAPSGTRDVYLIQAARATDDLQRSTAQHSAWALLVILECEPLGLTFGGPSVVSLNPRPECVGG